MITLAFGRTFEKQIATSGNVLPAATNINRHLKTKIEEKPNKCSPHENNSFILLDSDNVTWCQLSQNNWSTAI